MSHEYQMLAQTSQIKHWQVGIDIFQLGSPTIKIKSLSIFQMCDKKNEKKLHCFPLLPIQRKFKYILVELYPLKNGGPEQSRPALTQLFHTPTLSCSFLWSIQLLSGIFNQPPLEGKCVLKPPNTNEAAVTGQVVIWVLQVISVELSRLHYMKNS